MQTALNTWALLALSGAIYGVFLAAFLFVQKRGNRQANRYLAILVFLFALKLAEFAGYWTNYLFEMPHFIFFTSSFPFLLGVILYLYGQTLLNDQFRFSTTTILHFVPFAIQLFYNMPFYVLSGPEKIEIFKSAVLADNPPFNAAYFFIKGLQISHMIIYAALTFKLRQSTEASSNGNGRHAPQLKWLRYLTFGFVGFITLLILHAVMLFNFGYEYIVEVDYLILLISSLMLYAVGFMTLRHPEIFSGKASLPASPKYQKSALSDETAEAYRKKLLKEMTERKPFVQPDLRIQHLAESLSIPPYHLSQVINDKLGQNFFDFVNRFRVEEAKTRLNAPEYEHHTILSIALDVGFNNKASFNSAFKKHTGMTPSQFRQTTSISQ